MKNTFEPSVCWEDSKRHTCHANPNNQQAVDTARSLPAVNISHFSPLVSHRNGGRSTLYVTGACSQLVKLQYVQRVSCSMDAILALLRMGKIVEGFKLALFSEGRINVTEVFC